MKLQGLFRISFNRHGAAPLVWSICPLKDGVPTMDIAVRGIGLEGVRVATVYAPKAAPDEEDGRPSAYLVAKGDLSIDEFGVALITPSVRAPGVSELAELAERELAASHAACDAKERETFYRDARGEPVTVAGLTPPASKP